MAHYRELRVWNKAMDLTAETYRVVSMLPKEEMYALSSQMRRAAVSVPSNIAEGAGRKSSRDFCHFLKIAYGSLNELETQLILCCRLGYIEESTIQYAMQLLSETRRMLNALIQKMSGQPLFPTDN